MAVINGRTNKVITTIGVGIGAGQAVISPVSGNVYVSNYGGDAVTVINGRTNKVITTIDVGSPGLHVQGIAISPKTGDVYVADESNDSVSVISGKTNKVIADASVVDPSLPSYDRLYPYEVAVSPVTGAVYVVSNGYKLGNLVTVISGKTNKVTSSIAFPDDSYGTADVAISPVTGNVYAGGGVAYDGTVHAVGALWVVSGRTNKISDHVFIKDGVEISESAISPRTPVTSTVSVVTSEPPMTCR